jgi:hypothetical protein
MTRLENVVIAVAVVGAVGFVLDLLAERHTHRCGVCDRKATHFDRGCDESEVLVCPDCGGDPADGLDLALMARVAGLVGLVLAVVGVATGDALASLLSAPIALWVIWRALTARPPHDDSETGDVSGSDDEGVEGDG